MKAKKALRDPHGPTKKWSFMRPQFWKTRPGSDAVSMSDYYKGQRRFALGGKGWTVVLGCVVSLSYIRAKAKLSHEDFSQAHHTLKDHRGHEVKFEDQPEVPQQEDIVLRLWRRLPETPLPNLYWLGGLFTAFWAYRMWGAFNRLMVIRYADINYQLRRPDVLANKVVALKFLALPLTLVPAIMLGSVAFSAWWWSPLGSESAPLSSYLRAQAMAMKESFQQPCGEAHRTIHETVDPVASDLQQGPLATFARRSQTVGLLNIPKPDELILPRS